MYKDVDHIEKFLLRDLLEHLDKPVASYIADKDSTICRLLLDYIKLERTISGSRFVGEHQFDNVTGEPFGQPTAHATDLFSDYSFVVAPAYKAFEGFLYLLAEALGIKSRDEIIQTVGSLYDVERIQRLKEDIVTLTGQKLDRQDKKLLQMISELKRVLEIYRHSPAHFMGDRIDTFQKAVDYGRTVLSVINRTTKELLDRKLIGT